MRKLEIAAGLFVCIWLYSTTVLAEEEYYTWIDENGVTNYAERNPNDYNARYVTGGETPFGFTPRAQDSAPTPAEETTSTESESNDDEQEIDQLINEEKTRINA